MESRRRIAVYVCSIVCLLAANVGALAAKSDFWSAVRLRSNLAVGNGVANEVSEGQKVLLFRGANRQFWANIAAGTGVVLWLLAMALLGSHSAKSRWSTGLRQVAVVLVITFTTVSMLLA
jgi:hypothetical protein